MNKIFYAIGDSFAWGSELAGDHDSDVNFIFTEHKRKHVYSALVSDYFNFETYINAALPGASNERTYRILINDLSKILLKTSPNEIFVSISLTSCLRREFCNNNGLYYFHLNPHEPEKFTQQHKLWKTLVRYFNYDPAHYTYDNMLVLAMQNFLRVNKIPYLITTSMRPSAEEELYRKHIPNSLYRFFDNKRYHPDPSFQTWNAIHNLKPGKFHHPLEEGHKVWAEYLIKYITEHDLLSNTDL